MPTATLLEDEGQFARSAQIKEPTFVGARNELYQSLSEQENNKVRQELPKQNCDWVVYKMNVLHVCHMGAIWERQIGTVRNILTALLSHNGSQLDDESSCTFFTEAEAIVNCCPHTVDDLANADCRRDKNGSRQEETWQ